MHFNVYVDIHYAMCQATELAHSLFLCCFKLSLEALAQRIFQIHQSFSFSWGLLVIFLYFWFIRASKAENNQIKPMLVTRIEYPSSSVTKLL